VILVDTALERRAAAGQPILVAVVGAGFMGSGIIRQIARYTPGMRVAGIASRTLGRARAAAAEAGIEGVRQAATATEAGEIINAGGCALAEDPTVLCAAQPIHAVIEVTGALEDGARTAVAAIQGGKHLILMNAELDGTVGPILARRARQRGVIYTNSDGDQPGVTMNLYRFVRGIGVRPVLCGNIKGLHDVHRTPETQLGFARRWGQNPKMVTSFADGTKISFEQAIVANATGMRVLRRGMSGPAVEPGTPVEQVAALYPAERLLEGGGYVDYVVGAAPSPGVFVLGTHDDPRQRHYLNLYKLGEGPLYCFYTPMHLCHFEVPNTVARAVEFGDATLAPAGGLSVEVVCTAKRDLRAGDVLDGCGGFLSYGQCENAPAAARERLLPMGLSEGCRVTRAVPRDTVLTLDDVELPPGRLIDRLRAEQDAIFPHEGCPSRPRRRRQRRQLGTGQAVYTGGSGRRRRPTPAGPGLPNQESHYGDCRDSGREAQRGEVHTREIGRIVRRRGRSHRHHRAIRRRGFLGGDGAGTQGAREAADGLLHRERFDAEG
jgi:predicted homoserine dehydrogenase-like protein